VKRARAGAAGLAAWQDGTTFHAWRNSRQVHEPAVAVAFPTRRSRLGAGRQGRMGRRRSGGERSYIRIGIRSRQRLRRRERLSRTGRRRLRRVLVGSHVCGTERRRGRARWVRRIRGNQGNRRRRVDRVARVGRWRMNRQHEHRRPHRRACRRGVRKPPMGRWATRGGRIQRLQLSDPPVEYRESKLGTAPSTCASAPRCSSTCVAIVGARDTILTV